MNLLRSMCCLFGSRCAPEEAKSAGDTMRAEQSVPADLGQKEADLEKTGKEQMSHMEISQTWSQVGGSIGDFTPAARAAQGRPDALYHSYERRMTNGYPKN